MIFTIVHIYPEKLIKGFLPDDSIKLLIPGGRYNERNIIVDGTPDFKLGEKVIVFLEPEIKKSFRVTGWFQGKFIIEDGKVKEKDITLDQFVSEILSYLNK